MSRLKVPKYDLNSLAVVTVIFNPIKYRSRYELYHKFDEHMSRSGVTLLTVECIFDCSLDLGLPIQKFEITREKDRRHLRIVAPSVLWLKENLINIAMKRLPDFIEYVAWLDADIEFKVCHLFMQGFIIFVRSNRDYLFCSLTCSTFDQKF